MADSTVTDLLCPVGALLTVSGFDAYGAPMTERIRDGRHQIQVTPWGRSCRRCHKTWEFEGADLVATWDKLKADGPDRHPDR